MLWLSEEMLSRRPIPSRGNNIEMMERTGDDVADADAAIANDDDDDDDDDVLCESSSLAGLPPPALPASIVGSSVVGSIAHTLASTVVDGLVHTVAHWKVLLLGQATALVLAIAGGANDVLALECGVSAPGTYNAFGYALVGLFGALLVRGDMSKERRRGGTTAAAVGGEEREGFRRDGDDDHEDDRRGGGEGGEGGDGDDDDDDKIYVDAHDYDDDDVDDDLTLDDDDSPARRIRLFSLRRKNGDDDDDDDRRRRLRAAEERRRRRHHHRSRGVGASRGGRLRSSRPTHPFLFGLFEIRARWYYYLGVALVEAQAFYFIFLAFRYTTFTFVYVSDALAIPSAMLFSKMIMKRRYLWTHLLGCAICISGIVVNTASDLDGDGEGGGVRHSLEHIKGDVFAIIGAILLGLDDVLSEIIVNDYGGVNEMLFMKGLFGALISVVQLAVFERDDVLALFGNEGACDLDWRMMLFATHFGTRALSVAGEMQFLYMSEAALLNILLLTSDLFAAIFDVEENGLRLSPYFYAAFACIVIGIVLYEAGPSPAEQHAVTPLAIEFHCRKKKVGHSAVVPSSASTTEHAGNLSKDVDAEFT